MTHGGLVTPTGFLSTPSARRATSAVCKKMPKRGDFYPRPPRGGRQGLVALGGDCHGISIHALREEGDLNLNNPRSNSN